MVKDTEVGTITTVTTPSITTYQDGSVTADGIQYKTGKEIAVTVTDEKGNVKPLPTDKTATTGNISVYKFTSAITEAEVQVKGVTSGTAVSGASVNNNVLTFTPLDAGWYVIQYLTTAATEGTQAAYTYKVVYVAAATK